MKSEKLYDFTTYFLVDGIGGVISLYQRSKSKKQASKEIAKVKKILKPEEIDTQIEETGLVMFKMPKRTLDRLNKTLITWGNDPKDYQQNSYGGNQEKQK